MSFVIDSSMTLAWIYDDERTEATERVLDLVHGSGAWVPVIWPLEVANALTQGVKQRRIGKRSRAQALANLGEMNITVDAQTNEFAWSDTLSLADRFGLTLYDASYLELARRNASPLATLDRQLRAAAEKSGVVLL